ncbi:hypothetical protein PENTCL1PPCAC_5905, partial [Pristionchus entomophagus]
VLRELVWNGIVNCSDASILDSHPFTYETLTYNPIHETETETTEIIYNTVTELQSAQLQYGSFEWMKWMSSRLIFHDSGLSFYRRSIAEREFYQRDEVLIKRIRDALTKPSLTRMSTNLHHIAMDAFVNNIVEKITRGERLVEIDPPFADDETAEKLARFIRSRRMPPTD